MIILMFDDEDRRKEVLTAGVLDEWIENLGIWIPSMPIPNYRTWLSGSHVSGEQDVNEEIVENRKRSATKNASPMPMSRETVVPDSIQSQAVKTMELERMWEGNTQVDLRVRDTASWMPEEAIGIIERDDEQRCTAMDLSAECEFSGARQVIFEDKSIAISPINRGPQDRAKLDAVVEYGGQQRKVRQLSKILMTDSSPVRVETTVHYAGAVMECARDRIDSEKKSIQLLLRRLRCGMAIFQETKLEFIDDKVVKQVWHSNQFVFVFAPSIGRSRGVLCIWDPMLFSCDFLVVLMNIVVLVGRWGVEDWRCGIIGLYAPYVVTEQLEFWEKVVSIILEKNVAWCVGVILTWLGVWTRRGCVIGRRGISDFCDFVEVAALSDVSLQGKLFTWFDSLEVINLPRELSEHSPIMLVCDVCDSGPKPFRFFNAWLMNPQHIREMEGVWLRMRHEDVFDSLVRKLRVMKMVLKDWDRESFRKVNEKYRSLMVEIKELDTRLNIGEMGSSELNRKHELVSQLWAVSRLRESIW
ncbi:hypothetical protein V6N11_018136 [Hibiscus sabdariffa]|uniref:Uncharacterized protein n=1 Tax=Hibiscus sabdariffa TaxID=183260 RepID=A0ABR2T7F4_9ROSI